MGAMNETSSIVADLMRLRDEIRLQIHLGASEIQNEWERLELRWIEFSEQAELKQSTEDLATSVAHTAEEFRLAYERVKRAL